MFGWVIPFLVPLAVAATGPDCNRELKNLATDPYQRCLVLLSEGDMSAFDVELQRQSLTDEQRELLNRLRNSTSRTPRKMTLEEEMHALVLSGEAHRYAHRFQAISEGGVSISRHLWRLGFSQEDLIALAKTEIFHHQMEFENTLSPNFPAPLKLELLAHLARNHRWTNNQLLALSITDFQPYPAGSLKALEEELFRAIVQSQFPFPAWERTLHVLSVHLYTYPDFWVTLTWYHSYLISQGGWEAVSRAENTHLHLPALELPLALLKQVLAEIPLHLLRDREGRDDYLRRYFGFRSMILLNELLASAYTLRGTAFIPYILP